MSDGPKRKEEAVDERRTPRKARPVMGGGNWERRSRAEEAREVARLHLAPVTPATTSDSDPLPDSPLILESADVVPPVAPSATVAPDATVVPDATVASEGGALHATVAPDLFAPSHGATVAFETTVAPVTPAPDATVAPSATVAVSTTVLQWAVVAGKTPVDNTVLDTLQESLDPHTYGVYLRLYRLSRGWRKRSCTVGFEKLAQKTHMSKRKAEQCVEALAALGLIRVLGASYGGPVKGNHYEVIVPGEDESTVAPDATVASSTTVARNATVAHRADIKDSVNKNLKKDALRAEYVEILKKVREEFSGYPASLIASNFRAAVIRRYAGRCNDALAREVLKG